MADRQDNTNNDAAHSSPWATSEVIWLVGVALAVVLEYPFPISLEGILPMAVRIGLGVILLIGGAALVALAQRALNEADQPSGPGQPTTAIVCGGVYAYSRNPTYLGGLLALAGIALATNWPWLLILLIPMAIAIDLILIRPEERYLAAKFGADYEAYRSRVRRWF